MANKNAKHDPLEAAKITGDRAASDAAALGPTMHMDPRNPPAPVDPGLFVPPTGVSKEEPKEPLAEDGPTIEMYIVSGYAAEGYPPAGYAEKPSPGLTRFRAGGVIDPEWLEAARVERDAREAALDGRPSATPAPKKIVYVVVDGGRGNVGHGQTNLFRKGDVLELDGYGERGIQRLIDSGLKLEREER